MPEAKLDQGHLLGSCMKEKRLLVLPKVQAANQVHACEYLPSHFLLSILTVQKDDWGHKERGGQGSQNMEQHRCPLDPFTEGERL